MLEITKENFEKEVLKSTKPIIIDHYAEWCGPCKILSPTFERVATTLKEKATFAKCNVDENPDIAAQVEVRSIPTILIFHKGKEVHRIVGAKPEPALRQEFEQVIGGLK